MGLFKGEAVQSHHLEQEEFQVIGLLHAPQNGVVGALLPRLDLPQRHPGVPGGAPASRAASWSIRMNSASEAK